MPFGGLATTAAIGFASSLPKFYAAYKQNKAAGDVKLQDSTPAAFKERIGLSRLAANTARLPGQGMMQNRLAQGQAGAVQNARLGAGSGADFLAAAGAADAQRQAGEERLAAQGLQYQDGKRREYAGDLSQQAAYQQNDLNTYNRTKAALTQSAAQNLDNGISTLGSYAAQGLNMKLNADFMAGQPDAPGMAFFPGPPVPRIGMPSTGGQARRYPGLADGYFGGQQRTTVGLADGGYLREQQRTAPGLADGYFGTTRRRRTVGFF